jgi:hypothetical protein
MATMFNPLQTHGSIGELRSSFWGVDPGSVGGSSPFSFGTPTVGGLLQAAGSIYSGISTYQRSREYASDLRYQGAVAYAEHMRSANIIREEGRKFAAQQSLQYIGSGVQLMGSALVTIAQTKKYADTEAKAVETRGRAVQYLSERQASIKEDEGRAALVSGILGGIGSIF